MLFSVNVANSPRSFPGLVPLLILEYPPCVFLVSICERSRYLPFLVELDTHANPSSPRLPIHPCPILLRSVHTIITLVIGMLLLSSLYTWRSSAAAVVATGKEVEYAIVCSNMPLYHLTIIMP